jgi:large subunit ribosomal protein L29
MKGKLWNDIKSMADVELNTKLSELQNKFFKLKFRHSVSPIKNPLEIREIRKSIARIKTFIAQKKKSSNLR